MRWIVFFLVILNGLIFVWFSFQGDQKKQLEQSEKQEQLDFSSIKSIELLSELSNADLALRDNRVRGSQSVGMGDSDENVDSSIAKCALIGPFQEVISAKQVSARLKERSLSSDVVLIMKDLPATNWVYIAPLADRKKALAMLKDLQEKNIDSFLIADGEYANGISLGSFSSLDSAKAVLAERREQGYPVSLTERRRQQKTYWLKFDESFSMQVENLSLSGLIEGAFALKKQEKSCSEVALLQIIE
jgi:hypothetical protein